MELIKEYTISIVVVSMLAIVLESLLPDDHNKKYIRVMVGLLVMLVILKPLTRLPHYDETFQLPYLRLGDADVTTEPRPYIAESFEKRLALTISEDLHAAYGITVSCRVSCSTNEQGQITGIRQLVLSPYSPETGAYIAEKYGLEEAIITS